MNSLVECMELAQGDFSLLGSQYTFDHPDNIDTLILLLILVILLKMGGQINFVVCLATLTSFLVVM